MWKDNEKLDKNGFPYLSIKSGKNKTRKKFKKSPSKCRMTTLTSKNRKVIKDKKFMQWVVNSHPCYVCNLNGQLNYHQIQFHHLQGIHRIGAMLRDDSTGIPICYGHHQELTFKFGERKFLK